MADTHPSIEELLEALEAPGLLADQPAVQRLLAAQERPAKPSLTLIQGGKEDR